MVPENVVLVVKAPNQQIEDQSIECLSSWTVKQLKVHLSHAYPTKPKTDEQKIIYSGQLLEDSAVLKDVLRFYEEQATHTMHLVCAPNRREPAKPAPSSNEGLRRRTEPTPPPEPVPRAETSQNHQNHTVEMQNYLNSMSYGRVPPSPNYNLPQDGAAVTNQMLAMHQAYVHYMQQYAIWQAAVRGQAEGAAAPAAQPPRPARAAPEEDELHRDWLDHLYAASRLAILSSLIYLYGSGARLLLVAVLAVAGYLHQIGFFRELGLNRNLQGNLRNRQNANQANQNANPNANPANADANPVNDNANPPNANPADANANQANQNTNDQEEDDQRSLWSVTWMIFTTFFASLIPEAN